MDEKIDFGTVGLKTGDIITFQKNDILLEVSTALICLVLGKTIPINAVYKV